MHTIIRTLTERLRNELSLGNIDTPTVVGLSDAINLLQQACASSSASQLAGLPRDAEFEISRLQALRSEEDLRAALPGILKEFEFEPSHLSAGSKTLASHPQGQRTETSPCWCSFAQNRA